MPRMRLTSAIYKGFLLYAAGKVWAKNPGLSSTTATNCSVLNTNFASYIFNLTLTDDDIAALNIHNASKPFSNVEWYVEQGLAKAVKPTNLAYFGCWYVVQKWKTLTPLASGHVVLMRRNHDGTMTIVESTDRYTWRRWLRDEPYQHPKDYFGTPHVRLARLHAELAELR